ncbi:hypothetical protein FV217_03860 [Methylobacterium sp. WL9]|nr:hypothetical protein FV217_03860 [Methylobacterium sp. WL9]
MNLSRFAEGPRCGAKCRTSGEPCRNHAMANGRCRLHGGKTPKKDGWHQPQWPERNSADAMGKVHRKLKDRERQARKRATRLAEMTPERRKAHEDWHRARKPGPAAQRARARADRKQAAAVRKFVLETEAREAAEREVAQTAREQTCGGDAERRASRHLSDMSPPLGDIFA